MHSFRFWIAIVQRAAITLLIILADLMTRRPTAIVAETDLQRITDSIVFASSGNICVARIKKRRRERWDVKCDPSKWQAQHLTSAANIAASGLKGTGNKWTNRSNQVFICIQLPFVALLFLRTASVENQQTFGRSEYRIRRELVLLPLLSDQMKQANNLFRSCESLQGLLILCSSWNMTPESPKEQG